MTRYAKLLLLLFLCLLASVLIVTVPALSGGKLDSTVLVEIHSGTNNYIDSFSPGNPQGSTLFSSQLLPPSIMPGSVGITSDGQWLFARTTPNTKGVRLLLVTKTGHPFTNPPFAAIWASWSDDSQYLFYISVDSTGYYETFNFLKLSTGTLTELLVAPLSQFVNPANPPFQLPQYAVPMAGWTLKNKQILFTSYRTYPGYAVDINGFYSVDLSAIDLTRSGTWAMPKHTDITRAGQATSEGTVSPDGKLLAYIYAPDSAQINFYADAANIMAVQNLITGQMNTVAAGDGRTIAIMQWSEDSTTVAYTTSTLADIDWQNYLYDTKSQHSTRLPMDASHSLLCGNKIFYVKGRFRQATLYSVGLEDSDNPVELFTADGVDLLTCGTPYTWKPDTVGICKPFCTPTPTWPVGNLSDSDIQKLNLSGGNVANGQRIYTNYGCVACHDSGAIGPISKGTYTRVVTQRLKEPQLASMTPEQYIAESILQPNAYAVPGYPANVMPKTYGDQITLEELQDLIAYIKSLN